MNEDWRYTEERMKLRQEVFLTLKKYNTLKNVRLLYEFCHDWVSQGNQSTVGCGSKAFSNIENKLELKPNSIVRVPNGPDRYITYRVLVVLDRYFTVCINERTLTALCVFREDWSEVELLPETCLQFTEKKTVASATN